MLVNYCIVLDSYGKSCMYYANPARLGSKPVDNDFVDTSEKESRL